MYGFCVLMGGLAVNVSPIHDKLETIMLSPHGVLYLARKGHFIDVSDHDIKDKSKADLLAKGLVLLQITWTMLQCLSRKAASLPISVLEVHTLVHAGCALIMYCLWFNKPTDVEEPIIVSTAAFESDIALMLVRNQGSGVQPIGNLVLPREFQSACYTGSKYRDWPGYQASEASYLVFDPSRNHRSNPFSDASKSSVTQISGSSDGQQASNQACLRPDNRRLERWHSMAAQNRPSVAGTNEDPCQQGPCLSRVDTIPSQERAWANVASTEYRGNRVLKFVSPSVYERRKAEHQYQSSRLVDPAFPDKANGIDVWAGFHSCPPLGVSTHLSILTGDTASSGIGPNAFMVGPWTGETRQGLNQNPIVVLEVSENLQERLPLDQVRRSSVRSYCPLKISLSRKDLRRWRLAGTALHEEYLKANADVHVANQLVDFSGPGGSSNDVYFVTNSANIMTYVRDEASVVKLAKANRHIFFLQGVCRRLAEIDHLGSFPKVVTLVATAYLYAAIHLALWNYHFPTTAEKLLWRISASILLAIPTLLLFSLGASAMYKRMAAVIIRAQSQRKDRQRSATSNCPPAELPNLENIVKQASTRTPMSQKAHDAASEFEYPTYIVANLVEWGALGIFLLAALYLFSRIFIIVESFLSLRHVPIGVYAGLGWSKYIPHL